jgi:hypothetical protein
LLGHLLVSLSNTVLPEGTLDYLHVHTVLLSHWNAKPHSPHPPQEDQASPLRTPPIPTASSPCTPPSSASLSAYLPSASSACTPCNILKGTSTTSRPGANVVHSGTLQTATPFHSPDRSSLHARGTLHCDSYWAYLYYTLSKRTIARRQSKPFRPILAGDKLLIPCIVPVLIRTMKM